MLIMRILRVQRKLQEQPGQEYGLRLWYIEKENEAESFRANYGSYVSQKMDVRAAALGANKCHNTRTPLSTSSLNFLERWLTCSHEQNR